MNENLDKIADISDELEDLAAAMNIPMPSEFHVKQLKSALPEKIKAIREAIIKETGENPWQD